VGGVGRVVLIGKQVIVWIIRTLHEKETGR
jgi:hypothetical protein